LGLTLDTTVRDEGKRVSLKSVGLAVLATVRLQKWALDWAGSKKLRESLLRKLEGMKGREKEKGGLMNGRGVR